MKEWFKQQAVYWFYRIWASTWRKRFTIDPQFEAQFANNEPTILAHFHGDELALLHMMGTYHFATMTSTSGDGNLMTYLVSRLGGTASRGSSTRGGVQALKGLIKLVRKGHPACIAVDGPKGPIHVVKPGIFEISRLSGATIYSISVAASSYGRAYRSWNNMLLPKPFARVEIVMEKSMSPISREDDPKSTEIADKLSESILERRREAIARI